MSSQIKDRKLLGEFDSIGEVIKYVLAALATAGASMLATIKFLYNRNEKATDKAISEMKVQIAGLEKKSDQCIEDRNKLRVEVAELRTRMEVAEKG